LLFFASEGHSGFGGLDIFMTYKTEDGWAVPENVGSPINTPADDFSMYLDQYMENGYFASNREGGMGGDDIYRFSLTSILDPEPGQTLSSTTVGNPENLISEAITTLSSTNATDALEGETLDATSSLQR
jgi:hypothetical protein